MKRRYLPSAEYRPIVLPGKYCILQQYTDIVVLSDIYKRIAAFCQLTKILDYRLLKCFFYTLLYNASEENPDEWAAFQNEALNKDCPYQIVPIMIVCLMFND